MQFVQRACPVCSTSPAAESKYIRSKRDIHTLTDQEIRESWRGFRKESVFFDYVECSTCGTQFCAEYFSDSELNNLYSAMGDNLAGEEIAAAESTQLGYLRQVANYKVPEGTWVDIGADIGLLAHGLGKYPKVGKVIAIEPNLQVRTELLRRLRGDDQVLDNVDQLPVGEAVDGVIGVHVLDHVLSPVGFLARINDSLNPNGVVAFVTHSHSSLLRRLLRTKWAPYCLQHPQLYNRRSLKHLLSIAGFTDIHVKRTWNHISVRKIARVGLSILGLSQRWERVIPNFVIRIPLGNVIAIGRKQILNVKV